MKTQHGTGSAIANASHPVLLLSFSGNPPVHTAAIIEGLGVS